MIHILREYTGNLFEGKVFGQKVLILRECLFPGNENEIFRNGRDSNIYSARLLFEVPVTLSIAKFQDLQHCPGRLGIPPTQFACRRWSPPVCLYAGPNNNCKTATTATVCNSVNHNAQNNK